MSKQSQKMRERIIRATGLAIILVVVVIIAWRLLSKYEQQLIKYDSLTELNVTVAILVGLIPYIKEFLGEIGMIFSRGIGKLFNGDSGEKKRFLVSYQISDSSKHLFSESFAIV